jgi:carnitine O-acetyltransferase
MQIAFQLAYYRMNEELVPTYESVMMKGYLRGRTETGRPVTKEVKDFVESMEDIILSPVKKAEILRTASNAHVKQIADCMAGKGVDRHLWVLNKLMNERHKRLDDVELDKIFHDPSYSYFSHNVLSTSTSAIEGVDVFGFGPVVPDGFGLGYAANPSKLMVYVTCFREAGARANPFAKHIRKSLRDMHAILEEEYKLSNPVIEEVVEEVAEEASGEDNVEVAQTEKVE